MLRTELIILVAFGYVGLLFAIAHFADRRAAQGRSLISNPTISALSLAVYCTAWTFYGSVGRAATGGLWFLPTYLGPTLAFALGMWIIRKIIRISKVHRITSIADFIASRYGKSTAIGSMVTVIAVIGIIPYISLQLKAVSMSYLIINQYPLIVMPRYFADIPVFHDTALYVALLLALFAVLFGTRQLDVTERHEGLVAAIAFESLIKLIAFLAVGIFVTYGVFRDFEDLFARAHELPDLKQVFTFETNGSDYFDWSLHIVLSMTAVLFLPRQFQVTVVENVNEDHLNQAVWLFPLYLLVINLFVLPIAFGGVLQFVSGVDADTFVLTLPMVEKKEFLSLLVFIGGMSAATGMVIVETVALSTMICNDLVMPVLLRLPFGAIAQRQDFSTLVLAVRRGAILLVLLLAYAYFHFIGEAYSLVSIGLISFAAVAQFTPAMIGGIFWKRATRSGAMSGLTAGFLVWAYTLVLPSMEQVGLLDQRLAADGPFGLALLKPYELFGLAGLDPTAHAVFWSLLANTFLYIGVSLFSSQSPLEHTQAALFVDVFTYPGEAENPSFWRGTALVTDLRALLERILGPGRTGEALSIYSNRHKIRWGPLSAADPGLVIYAEKLLAGAIGSASARVMISSVVKEEPLGLDEVMNLLDETRRVIAYSRELERATAELRSANERLQELDRIKNEFISTVTHELRTPLTAVRSISEILHANPQLPEDQHQHMTGIIIKESERLTRLINHVLDFQRLETGKMAWQMQPVDLCEICHEALTAARPLMDENFRLTIHPYHLRVEVHDNGTGIHAEDLKIIFEEFRQARNMSRKGTSGSGLGLAITRKIVEYHGGRIWAESEPGQGSTFIFTLPLTFQKQEE